MQQDQDGRRDSRDQSMDWPTGSIISSRHVSHNYFHSKLNPLKKMFGTVKKKKKSILEKVSVSQRREIVLKSERKYII